MYYDIINTKIKKPGCDANQALFNIKYPLKGDVNGLKTMLYAVAECFNTPESAIQYTPNGH